MTDYYNVLGIKKDCTNTEIRSAYKKLAFKWHPDKNAQNKELANTKFKEISEAYKILGDKKKRKIYNQYGIENYENLQEIFILTLDNGKFYRIINMLNPENFMYVIHKTMVFFFEHK